MRIVFSLLIFFSFAIFLNEMQNQTSTKYSTAKPYKKHTHDKVYCEGITTLLEITRVWDSTYNNYAVDLPLHH